METAVPAALSVRQVYGFIFGLDGRILVQQNKRHHNLPGGKPEAGESFRDTLVRESTVGAANTREQTSRMGKVGNPAGGLCFKQQARWVLHVTVRR